MKKVIFLFLCATFFMFSCTKSDNNSNSSNNNNNSNNNNSNPYNLKACFTFSNNLPATGTKVIFNASCSQNATIYLWVVDGSVLPSISDTASYTFNSAGTHKVYLQVTHNGVGADTLTQFIKVTQLMPIACFNITSPSSTNSSYPVNTQLTFDASCSTDAEYFQWDFGDGSNGAYTSNYNYTTTYTYTQTGTFTVTIQATDPTQTYSNTVKKTITIH